ncbi:DNA polymerase III subunit epsilon [Vandammella animalimorsus]|uniref:DNA polymerase III subunit epsilon n=1 Tax=Vandammella animalimorsus TaxID=2029117 RepID=A0A3M6RKV7_9BURK|nr:DNA polymerase III subunit epsilon [Vandammella animalimorsus]RMX15969.1 DNA polymerase III subunit epsilon [Vandammella animalimorsus]
MRQIIMDTETTGLSVAEGDRVIELACVELQNRQLTGRHLHYYFKVDRDSHPDALRVHGITREFLSDKPRFDECVEQFLDFVRDAEIIIHNASFDVGFLDNELKLLGRPALDTYVSAITDSLLLARQAFPGKRNSLDALCDRFEIDKSSRTLHGALLDSELLAQVYLHLTRGQNALLTEDAVQEQDSPQQDSQVRVDFSQLQLLVLSASERELAEHEAVLQGIDKDSDGKTLWRQAQAPAH